MLHSVKLTPENRTLLRARLHDLVDSIVDGWPSASIEIRAGWVDATRPGDTHKRKHPIGVTSVVLWRGDVSMYAPTGQTTLGGLTDETDYTDVPAWASDGMRRHADGRVEWGSSRAAGITAPPAHRA